MQLKPLIVDGWFFVFTHVYNIFHEYSLYKCLTLGMILM